jgi:signal transduction histidine kinase
MEKAASERLLPVGAAEEARTRCLSRRFWARHFSRRLVVVTSVLLAMAHLGNICLITHFYTSNADREREAREATARLLAEHASRAFAAIDLTLETLADALQSNATMASDRVQALVEKRAKRLPQVRTLLVIGEDGVERYNAMAVPAHPLTLADRPYFRELKNNPALNSFIGARTLTRSNNLVTFVVSRPLRDADGEFRGVVAAVAEPAYFSNFYGSGELGHDQTAILTRGDGKLLAGSNVSNVGQPPDADVDDMPAALPGTTTSSHMVPSYDLRVLVAGPAPWRSNAFLTFLLGDVAGIIALTAIAFWLTGVLRREAKAREKAEILLGDAVENAPAGFALFDENDRLVVCNSIYRSFHPPAVRPLLVAGTAYETLIRAAAAASPPDDVADAATFERYVDARLAAHRARNGELVRQRSNGTWVLIRECPTDDGGTVVFETDISAMKQQEAALRLSEQAERAAREQAEEANRSKNSFLATMSHELRTPLNAIIGFSEIIECQLFGADHERYRDYGGLIRRSGLHLLAIINDILDIAKLQSGKTELHPEPTSIDTIVAESMRLVGNQAEAAHLFLEQEIERDLPQVRADAIRLRQVLLNLLSNAIKFTPGGGRVSIGARMVNDEVQIDVSDTGIGIAAEDIPRALEAFGQVSNTMTRTHEGTGLGLPLAKSLVELHGARFDITSAVGHGTTVSIIFPAELTLRRELLAEAPAQATPPIRRRAVG